MADALSASIFIGEAVSTGTSGSILFVDVNGKVAQNNASLFWDNANVRLTVGNAFFYTYGTRGLFIGQNAGNLTSTGLDLLGIGLNVLNADTTGFANIAIGSNACTTNTTGHDITAVGISACQFNTTGFSLTAVGELALQSNTTGDSSTAVGLGALTNNTTGVSNTAIGVHAAEQNITGSHFVAIGLQALHLNQSGNFYVAIGENALFSQSASDSIGIGYYAGYNVTTGTPILAIGKNSLLNGSTCSNVIALGLACIGTGVCTGSNIVAIGDSALANNTSGSDIVCIGTFAGGPNTTGNKHVFIGRGAGSAWAGGDGNIFIGYGADANGNGLTNATAIGWGATVTASNTMAFGGSTAQSFVFTGLNFTVSGNSAGFLNYTFQNSSNNAAAVTRMNIGNDSSPGAAQLVVYGSAHANSNILDINNANAAVMRFLTNNTLAMTIAADQGLLVGAPAGGTKGLGTINVATDIFKAGVAYINPKWVLQRYFTGKSDVEGPYVAPKWYDGLMDIEAHREITRAKHDLPLMLASPKGGMFERGDLMLASLEEAYLYIYKLHDRIRVLEERAA